jgi:hypothetical protein
MTDMAGALDRYAARFHARVGTGHHVASPLGAWLLLALCGPASHGPTRDQLTDVLGCDIDTASSLLRCVLFRVPGVVVWPAART